MFAGVQVQSTNRHESGGTKNQRHFLGRSVTRVESGVALRAWEILDFELHRHFDIAILATKTALKQ